MAAEKMSKMDAVRKAISELGKDASPVTIQDFVKTQFGLEMTTAHVSNYKTTVLREMKGKKPVAATETSIATPVASVASGSAISLSDIETVKGLVGRVGEKDLKSLIGLLG